MRWNIWNENFLCILGENFKAAPARNTALDVADSGREKYYYSRKSARNIFGFYQSWRIISVERKRLHPQVGIRMFYIRSHADHSEMCFRAREKERFPISKLVVSCTIWEFGSIFGWFQRHGEQDQYHRNGIAHWQSWLPEWFHKSTQGDINTEKLASSRASAAQQGLMTSPGYSSPKCKKDWVM